MSDQAAPLHPLQTTPFQQYCPLHEFDWWDCCACCTSRKVAMWQVDAQLRTYWFQHGYKFGRRAA